MSDQQSKRAWIAALHAEDCNRPQAEIARIVGCSVSYVGGCYFQLGLRVGDPHSSKPIKCREAKRKLSDPFKPRSYRIEECQRVSLIAGELVQCFAPTGGKTYCADCRDKIMRIKGSAYPPAIVVDGRKSSKAT